jgi:hypothetical protein
MKPLVKDTSGTKSLSGYSLTSTLKVLRLLSGAHFPLVLPGVHPLASLFILRKLKRLGFSNCRVVSSEKGLVVHAHR